MPLDPKRINEIERLVLCIDGPADGQYIAFDSLEGKMDFVWRHRSSSRIYRSGVSMEAEVERTHYRVERFRAEGMELMMAHPVDTSVETAFVMLFARYQGFINP